MFVVLELSSVIVDHKLCDCMLVPGNPIEKKDRVLINTHQTSQLVHHMVERR